MDWNGKSDPFVAMYWAEEGREVPTRQQTEAKLSMALIAIMSVFSIVLVYLFLCFGTHFVLMPRVP
jgi:hypothetical protein